MVQMPSMNKADARLTLRSGITCLPRALQMFRQNDPNFVWARLGRLTIRPSN